LGTAEDRRRDYFFGSSFFMSPLGAGAGDASGLLSGAGAGAGAGAASGFGAGAGGGAGSDFFGGGGGAGLSPQPLRPRLPAIRNASISERFMFFFLKD
jgi:hypothetical protein